MRPTSFAFLWILAVTVGCSGGDVKVVNIDDGSVIGELTPSLFGGYRDMVIGIDKVHGKIAAIEWGDNRSTLKIVTIKPWQVSKHFIDVGRPSGIDGPMSFDFRNNRFIYATDMYTKGKTCSLVTIELSGNKQERRYSTPVPKNHIIVEIIPTPEGMFFRSGKVEGDYLGFRLYRVAPDADSAEEIYRSKGRSWVLGVSGGKLCFADDAENSGSNVRLTLMDRASLAKTVHVLKWPAHKYAQSDDFVVQLSPDEKTLRRIPIASPDDAKEFTVPSKGDLIYGLACSQNHAMITRGNNTNTRRKVIILDFGTGQTKEMDIAGYQSDIETLRYDGKDYAILAE